MQRRVFRPLLFILMLVFATGPLPAYADVSRDLIRAIIKNDIPAVFRLVQAGANLNFRSPTGNTPLHEAAALGHGDIAQILVDGGASVTMKNNAGFTPLDWARRRGYPQIAELIACGAHLVLFVTGRGSVVGSAVSPVIKICANPETYARMADDMDIDAGRILRGAASLDAVGQEIYAAILAAAGGAPTRSEALGHQEFILTYKSFEPLGPACLPASA